MHINFFKAR